MDAPKIGDKFRHEGHEYHVTRVDLEKGRVDFDRPAGQEKGDTTFKTNTCLLADVQQGAGKDEYEFLVRTQILGIVAANPKLVKWAAKVEKIIIDAFKDDDTPFFYLPGRLVPRVRHTDPKLLED